MIGCMHVKINVVRPMRVCGFELIFTMLKGDNPFPMNIIKADTIVRMQAIDMHTR